MHAREDGCKGERMVEANKLASLCFKDAGPDPGRSTKRSETSATLGLLGRALTRFPL